jgi:hypothetical protein
LTERVEERKQDGKIAPRVTIPMCDVSRSMGSIYPHGGRSVAGAECMDVAIAMSLLVSEAGSATNPFFGKALTFSETPALVCSFEDDEIAARTKMEESGVCDLLKKESAGGDNGDDEQDDAAVELRALLKSFGSVAERHERIKGTNWGFNTDLHKAMELVCETAKKARMSREEVQDLELVIFSDMEFDRAVEGGGETALLHARSLFARHFGAGVLPKIVFWNLRASESGSGVAPTACGGDVALLSGFSAGLLRKYLKGLECGDAELGAALPPGVERDGDAVDGNGEKNLSPLGAVLKCVGDKMYDGVRLGADLADTVVITPREELEKRKELLQGENGAPVHASNESAIVAFFFEAVPGIAQPALCRLLDKAFEENALLALKLVFNLGSIRKHCFEEADQRIRI